MFDRVLIANRGEIVARIARTLRRLGCSPAAVRVRSDPALAALRGCDVSVEVGSYLDVEEIVAAAVRVGAQAVHPGYGFLSERAELARACTAAGLSWIGPPADAIELMGDKSAARAAAQDAGIAVVPGIDAPTPQSVARFAQEHGLPLIVKAAAGGGGKGMRLVRSLADLEPALAAARREAAAAFGDDALLVERLIAPARHLEMQVLADAHGNVLSVGERECTLQRRHQKVIEETPSGAVDAALREALAAEGVALARACGYVGAGTIEFVADARDPARHYFLEMNTRLQVEHPVTEAVHGLDLVEWQLRVACGERIERALDSFAGGHAIEARVYAEDPARGFLPAAGRVRALVLPAGPGIRVDAGIAAGEAISTRYDPMIAKVVAHGATRPEALSRLRAALAGTVVLGVRSNVGFLLDLLADERVQSGEIDTALVESFEAPGGARAVDAAAARAALVALAAAGAQARDGDALADPFVRLAGWRVGGPGAPLCHLLEVDGEHEVEVALGPLGGPGSSPTVALLDGAQATVALEADEALGGGRRLGLAFDGAGEEWVVAPDGDRWWVGRAGRAWLVGRAARERGEEAGGERDLRAPMPGSIVAVYVGEGAEVERGDVVLVMESMKMELQITAPRAGTVAALHVAAGDQVALDALLASIAPAGAAERAAA
jgi:acetyl-CoA/propionyl-CoA carboxylase, biotin carboxylase, biotin carboxyl carrier protein